MLSNYYTLAILATDLDSKIRDRTITGAYSQEKDELVLSFDGLLDSLIVSCSPNVNTLYLHSSFSRARANSVDVLKTICGKQVVSVSIQPMDRVISFQLQDGVKILTQFFGSKANVLLVDDSSLVVDAFKNARSVVDSRYAPLEGEIVHDFAALRALVAEEPTQTVFSLLKRAFPVLGSTLANEILFRAGVSVRAQGQEMSDEQIRRLAGSFTTLLTELSRPIPRVYIGKEPPHTPHRFSVVALNHCHDFEERLFPDIHEAIRFFISKTRSASTLLANASEIVATLHQHSIKLQRTIGAVEEDLKTTSRADEYDRYATTLMANLGAVKKGMKSATFPSEDGPVTVPLDSALSPVQNAQRHFEKAKKSRLAYDQSRKRLVELRGTLHLAEELLAAAEAITTKEGLRQFMGDSAKQLDKFGIGEKAKEREELPFRIFVVDGGFEVWAGKSSRNNDELTMKHSKPNDLWFHARGASGSHVVLKTNTSNGEPSKKAKEQAAGIAAHYSKMKNAKMVPVAMTERKYVRKPKGAPPGTVVLEREKVIFAEPALPKGKAGNG